MSGEIEGLQEIVETANRSLTNSSAELSEPIEKCEKALGIFATTISVINELWAIGNEIGQELTNVDTSVANAKEHITDSAAMQRLTGMDQPSAPGHQIFTETNTALEKIETLQTDLTEGINVSTSRDKNKFTFYGSGIEGIKGPLISALSLLKEAQQKNIDAVGAANAFIESNV